MTMMVPFQVIMIPLYMEEYLTGILNTYVGLVLPRIASAYGMDTFSIDAVVSGRAGYECTIHREASYE